MRPRDEAPASPAYVLLAGYTILVFVPFAWSLVTSFKTLPDSLTLSFLPHPFTTYGYQKAITQLNPSLPVLLANSTLIATVVTVTNVVLGALAGYAFARLRFPGREVIFLAVLGTLMIPDQLRLVPVYQILTGLRLVTPGPANYAGLVSVIAVRALSILLMRQYFLTLPYDLEEAAGWTARGVHDLLAGHPAQRETGAGGARDPQLPGLLEHVLLAARDPAGAGPLGAARWASSSSASCTAPTGPR